MSNESCSRRLTKKRKKEGRCTKCGGDRDNPRYVYCTKCRKNNKVAQKRLKAKRIANQICCRCGKNPVQDGYQTCSTCDEKAYAYRKARPEYAKRQREKYQAVKAEVFEAYGGYVCACCGETEPLFLCIDHIDGGGERHRADIGVSSRGRSMYTWLKNNGFPPGFQVLCHNCNMGKHLNNGTCPHAARNILAQGLGNVKPVERGALASA